MKLKELSLSLKGNLRQKDVEFFSSELSSLFAGKKHVSVQYTTDHTNPDTISMATDIIASIAAFLYIFIEGPRVVQRVISKRKPLTYFLYIFIEGLRVVQRMFSKRKPLTYDDLIKSVKSMMAHKGITAISIVDIANFRSYSSRNFKEPCILTLRDLENNKFYKVFVFNEGDTYDIAIETA